MTMHMAVADADRCETNATSNGIRLLVEVASTALAEWRDPSSKVEDHLTV